MNKCSVSAKPPTSKNVPPKGRNPKSEPLTSEKPNLHLFNRKEGKSFGYYYLLLIQAKYYIYQWRSIGHYRTKSMTGYHTEQLDVLNTNVRLPYHEGGLSNRSPPEIGGFGDPSGDPNGRD